MARRTGIRQPPSVNLRRRRPVPPGMKRLLVLIALALLALAVTSAQGAGKTVVIRSLAFHPGTLTVPKGSQVTFSNSDGVTHTATDNGVFDSGRIKPGKSFTVRFKQKGTFAYHCKIHPTMHGKIVVN
jgi:plastocyanin